MQDERASSYRPRARSAKVDGEVRAPFEALTGVLERMVWRSGGGAALCVYHRGEPVADLWAGVRDRAGRPWQRDTMSPSFSTTKGVAATTLHVLVDRGLLDYDDRVSRFWPEFAQANKQDITVRQVLCHQSGLYHIRQMIDRAEELLDWQRVIRAIERATPIHKPGERTGYHGLTFGFLVGEIVQRVTGMAFSEVVRETLARPLGLDGCFIGTPEHELHRAAELIRSRWVSYAQRFASEGLLTASVAALIRAGERVLNLGGAQVDAQSILDALAPRGISWLDFSAWQTLRATIPAANGLFTARSLARIYAALAAGGALDGVRILSEATLKRATERQPATEHIHVIPFDMGWRLGYHSVITSQGCPRQAYGHFGLGGSGAWADPELQLAVALIVNSGVGSPLGDLRIVRIGGAALACARRA
jgi:CubicO group peptidase (beta-lactamase class C family)